MKLIFHAGFVEQNRGEAYLPAGVIGLRAMSEVIVTSNVCLQCTPHENISLFPALVNICATKRVLSGVGCMFLNSL